MGSLGRLEVAGDITVRVGSLGRPYVSSGPFGFACVPSGASNGRRVHSGSCTFTQALLWVTEIIGFHVGSHMRAERSAGLLGFPWVHSRTPKVRRVHCVFTHALLKLAGFIRVSGAHLGAPWGRQFHSNSLRRA